MYEVLRYLLGVQLAEAGRGALVPTFVRPGWAGLLVLLVLLADLAPRLDELGCSAFLPDAAATHRCVDKLAMADFLAERGLAADDLERRFTFRLFPDGRGEGTGPDATTHTRFRSWKEALRDDG